MILCPDVLLLDACKPYFLWNLLRVGSMVFIALRRCGCDVHCFESCLPKNQNLFFPGVCWGCARCHSLFPRFHLKWALAFSISNLERMTVYVEFKILAPDSETLGYLDHDICNLKYLIGCLILYWSFLHYLIFVNVLGECCCLLIVWCHNIIISDYRL